jgi:hypothetical protein
MGNGSYFIEEFLLDLWLFKIKNLVILSYIRDLLVRQKGAALPLKTEKISIQVFSESSSFYHLTLFRSFIASGLV